MNEKELYRVLSVLEHPVYPITLPMSTSMPAITYMLVHEGIDQCHGYDVVGKTRRYQVDVWAESYAEAKSIAQSVVESLIEYRCFDVSVMDSFEDDTGVYRQIIDIKTKE